MARWIKALIATAILLALISAVALAAPKTIQTTDFSVAKYYKIAFKVTDSKDIAGKLPSGWNDNSEWNTEITVSYNQTTEDGATFLRMEKSVGTRAQLAYNISKKLPAGTYRFTMELKSPSSATPEIGVRLSGEPYSFLWSTKPALSDSWDTIEEEIELDPQGAMVGIYICLDSDGGLDLKNVKLEQL